MAFLNIEAKLRETVIDGASLLSFVRGVRHVAVDRVFLMFDSALKPRMARSVDFAGAPGPSRARESPPVCRITRTAGSTRGLPKETSSYRFRRMLSVCRRGSGSLVHSADVDIDLGRGLAHAKEWLENNVFKPGHKTSQALVYALLYAQGILPPYTLDPVAETTHRAVTPMRVTPTRMARTRAARKSARRKKTGRSRTRVRRSTRR